MHIYLLTLASAKHQDTFGDVVTLASGLPCVHGGDPVPIQQAVTPQNVPRLSPIRRSHTLQDE